MLQSSEIDNLCLTLWVLRPMRDSDKQIILYIVTSTVTEEIQGDKWEHTGCIPDVGLGVSKKASWRW